MISWTLSRPGAGDEHEQFFHRRISDRDTSDGLRASMDHDVTAKDRKLTPVSTGLLDISRVRIIDAQGQMVSAVRIQKLNPIDAFGDLFITFAQLGTGNSARRENRVGENKRGAHPNRPRHKSPAAFLPLGQAE